MTPSKFFLSLLLLLFYCGCNFHCHAQDPLAAAQQSMQAEAEAVREHQRDKPDERIDGVILEQEESENNGDESKSDDHHHHHDTPRMNVAASEGAQQQAHEREAQQHHHQDHHSSGHHQDHHSSDQHHDRHRHRHMKGESHADEGDGQGREDGHSSSRDDSDSSNENEDQASHDNDHHGQTDNDKNRGGHGGGEYKDHGSHENNYNDDQENSGASSNNRQDDNNDDSGDDDNEDEDPDGVSLRKDVERQTYSDNDEDFTTAWNDLPNVIQLTDANFEHETQATTGSTTGNWLFAYHFPPAKPMQVQGEIPDAAYWYDRNVVLGNLKSPAPITLKRLGLSKSKTQSGTGLVYLQPQGTFHVLPLKEGKDMHWTDILHFCEHPSSSSHESSTHNNKIKPMPGVMGYFQEMVSKFMSSKNGKTFLPLLGTVFALLTAIGLYKNSNGSNKNNKKMTNNKNRTNTTANKNLNTGTNTTTTKSLSNKNINDKTLNKNDVDVKAKKVIVDKKNVHEVDETPTTGQTTKHYEVKKVE